MATHRCTVTVSAQPAGSPGPVGPVGPAGPPGPQGPAGVGGVLSPYITPPTTPAAFNDEFDGGSPVLADRGWQTFNSGDGVPMVRRGDVTLAAPTLTGHEYNSTLVNGTLRVQATSGMMVLKPVVAPVQLVAKLSDPTLSVNHYCALQLTMYNGAIGSTSKRVASGYTWGKYVYAAMSPVQFWYTHRNATPPEDGGSYVFMLEVQAGTGGLFDWRNAVIEPHSGRIKWLDKAPLNMADELPTFGGVEVLTSVAAYSWVEIDYLRRYPYGSWFPA